MPDVAHEKSLNDGSSAVLKSAPSVEVVELDDFDELDWEDEALLADALEAAPDEALFEEALALDALPEDPFALDELAAASEDNAADNPESDAEPLVLSNGFTTTNTTMRTTTTTTAATMPIMRAVFGLPPCGGCGLGAWYCGWPY